MTRRRYGRFVAGVVTGLALLLGGRLFINSTPVADWLVGPLLLPATSGTADAIVVLGAGVIGDCVPNTNGVRRVVRAARAYHQGRAPVVFFLGGTADGSCPVSRAMARLAMEFGVPAASIVVEPTSLSTRENAERSVPFFDARSARRLLLVTDLLHMPRAEQAFIHYGFEIEREPVPVPEAHDDNVEMLIAGVREGVALADYRLRGWLTPAQTSRPVHNPAVTSPSIHSHQSGPLVILGASYAGGWTPGSIGGRAVINKGIAGQETGEILGRFQRDVASSHPRAVILWGFINDVFRAQGEIDPVLSGIRSSYTEMIKRAKALGIEPVLVTEVTVRPSANSLLDALAGWAGTLLGRQAYQDGINRHIMAINGWMEELGRQEGILVLDFQAVLADSSGRRHPAFAMPDGSHITPAGYEALTAYAKPVLEERLATP